MKPIIRAARLALVTALGCLGVAPAMAQVPATEAPPRIEASAQFTFLDAAGNSDAQSLGTGGDVTWRPGIWTHKAKAVFAQSEADGMLDARSLTGLFRSSRKFRPRLSGYLQYDYLRDVFAGVEQRHIAEAGASYQAVDTPRQKLRLDAGIGYLVERGPGEALDTATLSGGALYAVEISKTAKFEYEPRYLLTLTATDAWKFDQVTALAVAISSTFSLKASHTLRYAGDPPDGFEKTDTITAVSLVARIARP